MGGTPFSRPPRKVRRSASPLGLIPLSIPLNIEECPLIVEMVPESQEDGRAQLDQLLSSYEELENSLDQVAQQQGLQEMVNQAAQQAQEAAGQEATEQAQESANQEQ